MSNQVAVVTGGGRGIGRAISRRFALANFHVVSASRSDHELAETKSLIEADGGRCDVQPTDVCSDEDIGALVETTLSKLGRIDVLVNNAGVAPNGSIEELNDQVFDTMLAINVGAVYRTSQAVWPAMKKQGGGVIVNISSVAAIDPFPGFAAYGASKAWVSAWTRGLAAEGKPHGILVFAIAPGAVETRMLRDALPSFPAGDALAAEEIAEAVYNVTTPACRHMSGQTMFVKK
jgi:3-oxoacyl-[acyl-carrier protein] reductase